MPEGALSVLQQAVAEQSLVRPSSPLDTMWDRLDSMDWKQNKPWYVAKVLTESPYNYAPAVALAVVFTAMRDDLNPFTEIYAIGGKPAFYVETKLKIAKKHGLHIGTPQFKEVKRAWPIHLISKQPIMLSAKNEKKEPITFKLEEDFGVECTVQIGDGSTPMVQTAWFSICYKFSEQWLGDPNNMLQLRALDDCVRFGSGEGLSAIPGGAPVEIEKLEESPKLGKVVVAK